MKILLVANSHRVRALVEPLRSVQADFQTVILNSTRHAKLLNIVLNSIREVLRVVLKLRTYNPEIILSNDVGYTTLTALLLSKIAAKPFVVRLGGDVLEKFRVKMTYCKWHRLRLRLLYLWFSYRLALFIIKRSDGVITVDAHAKESLPPRVNASLKIETVPVPADLERFSSTCADSGQKAKYGPDTRLILTVTNLQFEEKFKGLKRALPGIASLLERYDDLVFLVAGAGEFFSKLEEHVKENYAKLFDNRKIILLGFVQKVEELLAISDIVVYYSLRDGCPNVMLEAWASRKPLVVNDAPWSQEFVRDGAGVVVKDDAELAGQLEMLLNSAEAREEVAEKGYEYVRQNFTYGVIGRRLEDALDKLVNK